MKIRSWLVLTALLGTAGCVAPVKSSNGPDTAEAAVARRSLAMAVIGGWHETSALAARGLIQQYGVPDEVRYGRLVWNDARPWRRVVVRDVTPSYRQDEDLGVIEQTVDYPMTATEASEVAAFDARVRYDAATGELSARSDREALNILRFNLADEIVGRRLDPAQAREEYARAVTLEASGKTSPSMVSLRFLPVRLSRP